jgi:hypothetical protein
VQVNQEQTGEADRKGHEKIALQWKYPTMRPPAIGPNNGPTSAAIATKLMARTNLDFANVRAMVSRPTGIIMEPPQQDTARDQHIDICR